MATGVLVDAQGVGAGRGLHHLVAAPQSHNHKLHDIATPRPTWRKGWSEGRSASAPGWIRTNDRRIRSLLLNGVITPGQKW